MCNTKEHQLTARFNVLVTPPTQTATNQMIDKEPRITMTFTESEFLLLRDALQDKSMDWLLKSVDSNFEFRDGADIWFRRFDALRDRLADHYKNVIQTHLIK